MALTPTQLTALKTAINADGTLSAKPNTPDGNQSIADAMNLTASPDFFVWQTAVPVADIYDQIVWANYTPSDAPDTTVIYQNRAMLCQTKQINLQLLLQGRDTFNAAKATVRGGLTDATQSIPSGTAGANRSGGWANIQPVLSRKAKRGEQVLSAGTGSVASPATMGFEGMLTRDDVEAARNS